MSAPSSDSPAPVLETGTLAPKSYPLTDLTASLELPCNDNLTRSFEEPADAAAFPEPCDRYELLEFLARGGMGEVWTARDRVLNREVALKLLRDDVPDRTPSESRFVEEARITGKLQHPGIPPIHDLGTLRDGRRFIAMKLIRGRTLADLLVNARPPLAELLRTFEEVCQAVAAAHDRRVIHRDLKPGNVMVGRFNEVQVMDWGLAKVLGEPPPPAPPPPTEASPSPPVSVIESDRDPSSHTRAGSLLGTPAYMPPEQAKGDIDRTDTRSDVFALGAMLCEILTGRPPYWAAMPQEVLALAITAQLGPAFERLDAAGADAELVELAKRCLRADPDARPADAKVVAAAVAAFRVGVEARLRAAERDRAAAEARLVEQRKRRRVQQALAAAAFVIVAGVAGGAWWADKLAADRDRERRDAQAELDRLEVRRQADARQKRLEDEARAGRTAEAVAFLLADANVALAADDADRAAVPLDLLQKRLAELPPGAPPADARARGDYAMLRALDAADDQMWGAEDFRTRLRRATEAWGAAFREYGYVPGTTPAEAGARLVTSSVIRDRLLLTLDLWLLHDSDAERRVAVRNLLRAADPDEYRLEFRAAVVSFDLRTKLSLLDDARAARQPARFAAVLGHVGQFPAAARETVLRPALARSPNNFPLLLTMLAVRDSHSGTQPDGPAQTLRWAQAAVSVRPGNKTAWRSLGRAHWLRGDLDEAVRCFRHALRLDARDPNTWTQLSAVLLARSDPEAALEAADRALECSVETSY